MEGFDGNLIANLLLAALLGSLVGFEREIHEKAAGFRTHALVCVGSALIMEVSVHFYENIHSVMHADPGRIAAQVVSGIGFLGAGTIIRSGRGDVRGLTTAASLWTVSGIGLAIGANMRAAAIAATFIVIVVLFAFAKISRNFQVNRKERS